MTLPFAAGIIPWTQSLAVTRSPLKSNSVTRSLPLNKSFLLGLETSNKKWSGFVGGQEPGESIPETAIREFNEETSGLFKEYLNEIYLQVVNTVPYIDTSSSGRNVYLFFIEFNEKFDVSQFKFNRSLENAREYREKSDLRWFSTDEIKTTKNIFYKIKRIIC